MVAGLQRIADNGRLAIGVDPSVMAAGLLAAYQGGLLLVELKGDVDPLRHALAAVTDLAIAPSTPA